MNDVEVASNAAYTVGSELHGLLAHRLGHEAGGWSDAPTSGYLNGSVSEVAVIPSQLTGTASGTQIYTLYHETTTTALTTYVTSLSPTSYWPLQDSATNICATPS